MSVLGLNLGYTVKSNPLPSGDPLGFALWNSFRQSVIFDRISLISSYYGYNILGMKDLGKTSTNHYNKLDKVAFFQWQILSKIHFLKVQLISPVSQNRHNFSANGTIFKSFRNDNFLRLQNKIYFWRFVFYRFSLSPP